MLLGYDAKKRLWAVDLVKIKNLLITTEKASEEPEIVDTLLCTLFLWCNPHDMRVVFFNPEEYTCNSYINIPNLVCHRSGFRKALKSILKEIDMRYRLLAKHSSIRIPEDPYELIEKVANDDKLLPFIIVIAHCNEAFVNDTTNVDMIIDILRLGRGVGIHFIVTGDKDFLYGSSIEAYIFHVIHEHNDKGNKSPKKEPGNIFSPDITYYISAKLPGIPLQKIKLCLEMKKGILNILF
jgi:DNA segregation ATPase FtsK/SpoIIIE-like protein